MEFYDVVEKRRTLRSFSDNKISQEIITKVLEAGIKAPTYNHLREWDFVLASDPNVRLNIIKAEGIPDNIDVAQLEQSFTEYDSISKEMYLDAIPKQKGMLLKAPELLVVVFKPKTEVEKSTCIYDLNCLASVWCCIENMLLALAAEDLYGVTYIPQKTDDVKRVLDIPEYLEIAALIPFGYKMEGAKQVPQKRVELKDKIHFNKW